MMFATLLPGSGDPMAAFFWSGQGHVYYAIMIAIGVTIAVLVGETETVFLFVPIALMAGTFADLWAHGYQH